jgi:hypothetical protein
MTPSNPSPASSNEPEAAEVSQIEWNALDAMMTKVYSCLCGGTTSEIKEAKAVLVEAATLRAEMNRSLRCRPVAELPPGFVDIDDYIREMCKDPDYAARHLAARDKLRTRPVSVDKLELHSLDYAIRALQMEGGYDVTVARLTDLRDRLREGAK